MSKGSLLWLCSLVLLQVCIAQLSLISGSQLTGGQIGGHLLCQDPIRRAWLMSRHGHDAFGGHSADVISDEELADEGVDTSDGEYTRDDRGMPVAVGEAGAEEEEGLLRSDGDDDGGGTKDCSGSGGDVECPECGKFFKNDKSMFGHLRSHPNRGYKGATPPMRKLKLSPETAAASSSSSSRGIDRPTAQRSGRDPQLTPSEILCAYGILTIKYRDNKQATQVPPPPPSSSFRKPDAIGQAEGGIRGSAAAKIKGNNAGNVGNYGERSSSFVKIPKKRRNVPKEVSEAHRKKAKLVPTLKEKRPYVCKHCKEEFSTHQALGGHMAGHHREKKVPAHQISMAAESQSAKQQVGGGDEDGNRWRDNDLSPPGLLSEQFSMVVGMPWQRGQASGGQMRQHSERNDGLSPAPTPPLTDDAAGRRLFNIDLNVKAPEQE